MVAQLLVLKHDCNILQPRNDHLAEGVTYDLEPSMPNMVVLNLTVLLANDALLPLLCRA